MLLILSDLENGGRYRHGNCGDSGKDREEQRNRARLPHNIVEIEHFTFPFASLGTSSSVRGSNAFPRSGIVPDLMQRVYVRGAFAKMTALPDNLTETPHRNAQRGDPWTF
jgi:hypothetical protein